MLKAILASGAMLLAANPAAAAIVTQTYSVSDFTFSAGDPINPVIGNLTITYDDAVDVAPTTQGLVVSNLNLPLDFPIKFSSWRAASINFLSFGTHITAVGSSSVVPTARSFSAVWAAGTERTVPVGARYTVGDGKIYNSVTVAPPPAPEVPEPATWAMMLGGFGLIGMWTRQRARAEASVA